MDSSDAQDTSMMLCRHVWPWRALEFSSGLQRKDTARIEVVRRHYFINLCFELLTKEVFFQDLVDFSSWRQRNMVQRLKISRERTTHCEGANELCLCLFSGLALLGP